jgi:HlyD family secretion protein
MKSESIDITLLSSRPPGEADPVSSVVPLPALKWKTRILLPAAVVTVVGGLFLWTAWDSLIPSTPVKVAPVVLKYLATTVGGATVQAPGWVEPAPYANAVSALTDGIVKEVVVLEGQIIEADQVVARLVADDARLARDRAAAELDEVLARHAESLAMLKAAQRRWESPIELQRRVAYSRAVLDEARAELDRWPAELTAAQAKEAELGAEDERITRLRENQQAGEIEWIRARRQYEAQKGVVASIRGRRAILEAKIKQMEAEAHAAAEDLRLRIEDTRALEAAKAQADRDAAAVERARTVLAEAELRLGRMEVRTPVGGVVMNRLVQPGSKLMLNADNPTSAQILRVYDPQQLQVRVDVPLIDASHVGVGQQTEIVVSVLPDRTFKGRVTRLVHEADIQKNTIQAKVEIESPSPELKPEMLARVRFLPHAVPASEESRGNLFAPESVIHKDAAGLAYAWVVVEGGRTLERRSVDLGTFRLDGWIEVRSGLRAGDRLVADPISGLSNGQRVHIVEEQTTSATTQREGAHAWH